MYHTKDDPRSQRSANVLFRALIDLLEEKPFGKIKISDLVSRAEVGRATFYRNFDSVEDILWWRSAETVDQLILAIMQDAALHTGGAPFPLIKPMLRFFDRNSEIVKVLIAACRTDILRIELLRRMEAFRYTPQRPIEIEFPPECGEYASVIRSGMAVSVIVHWISRGKPQAPDVLAAGLIQMADQLGRLKLLV